MIDGQEIIKERFDVLLQKLEKDGAFSTYKALADKLDYKPQKLNEVLKGRTKLNLDFLQKFCTVFSLSIDEIVFGKPKKQKEGNKINVTKNVTLKYGKPNQQKEVTKIEEDPTTYLPIINQNVTVLDAVAAASDFLSSVKEATTLKNSKRMYLPMFSNRNGEFYGVSITGDSMHPTIKHKDIVVGSLKPLQDFIGGLPYVIFHKDEGLLCKRLRWHNKETGELCLKSDNEYLEDFITHIKNVQPQILKIEVILSENTHNWNSDVRNDIKDLKQAIKRLEGK